MIIRFHDERGREVITTAAAIDMFVRASDSVIKYVLIGGERFTPSDQFEALAAYVNWTQFHEPGVYDEPTVQRVQAEAKPVSTTRKK